MIALNEPSDRLYSLASLLHYTFIISPKGPALLALLERAHKLIPYALIKQTLKVGNAATMINGMVSIVLAKASVGALTNWIGFSEGAAEGMNLLQTIVSTVLGWDNKKLRARIAEIEKDRESPSKDQLSTLKEYTNKSREEQMKLRQDSRSTSKSIISIILSLQPDHQISEPTHRLAMEYLDLLLSIRDHEQLSTILCNHNPDLLTPILRDLVSAYDPIIRGIHNAVNLSGTISDAQAFIRDFIQLSRRSTNSNPDENVSVRDYVELLEKHQSSSHRFLHQVTKNGKELTATYLAYVHTVIEKFKHDEQATRSSTRSASLGSLIQSLPDPTFTKVSAELTSHSNYLDHISSASSSLASEVMQSNSNTSRMTQGPGVYLVRWQSLLDSTEISPSEARGGKIRHGADLEVREAARVDVDGSKKGSEDDVGNAGSNEQAPDLTNTLSALREKFCESLRTWKA